MMGFETFIEWCDHTFNTHIGCFKISPACANCYASVSAPTRISRSRGDELWGPNAARRLTSEGYWKDPIHWNKLAISKFGRRARVFSNSLSDIFEEHNGPIINDQGERLYLSLQFGTTLTEVDAVAGLHVPLTLDDIRAWAFKLIQVTPDLEWLLLTKRISNVKRMIERYLQRLMHATPADEPAIEWAAGWLIGKHPENVRLGVSIENQARADECLFDLLRFGGPNFLSMEPLLGFVNLDPWIDRLDWVIVGGETQEGARPMHPEWARHVRNQCESHGVPFFFKQWGDWGAAGQHTPSLIDAIGGRGEHELRRIGREGLDVTDLEELHNNGDAIFRKVGKKMAGRRLDGRMHHTFPASAEAVAR